MLCQGRHLALIAPRQSGKALVLYELRARGLQLTGADRPDVFVLRSLDFQGDTRTAFVEQFIERLGVSTAGLSRFPDQPLASEILELLRHGVLQRRNPLWLFVQNITELAWPFARALLLALQSASEDTEFRGKFAVAITGGHDFVPLTFDAN